MQKKYSLKFWLFFWLLAVIFLSGWYLFWNIKYQGASNALSGILQILPFDQKQKNEYQALATIAEGLIRKDNQEKTFLILFQNTLEIRPGGGFIGSFGVLKIKNGKVESLQTHDVSAFDDRIPDVVKAPYPIDQIMHTEYWKLRDSNFSPDFQVDAQNAKNLYYLGQGQEKFDGVIGITSNVLTSILKITGPVSLDGYPGTYDSNNAIVALEYQVEKAFEQQGIARGERKSVMGDLAQEIEKKVSAFSVSQKIDLAKTLLADLNDKDIQLQFDDAKFQAASNVANWSGKINNDWGDDYLAINDANLGAYKSDYYIKRSIDYTVDFTGNVPSADLKITYNHTATQKDWMTTNYLTYLRVYVPNGSWLTSSNNFDGAQMGDEFGKKYFGAIVRVPIGTSKTVELNYTLGQNIFENTYKLLIQKQAGLDYIPTSVHIINKDGSRKDFKFNMNSDLIVQN